MNFGDKITLDGVEYLYVRPTGNYHELIDAEGQRFAYRPAETVILRAYSGQPGGILPLTQHSFRHLVGTEVEVLSKNDELMRCRYKGETFYWPVRQVRAGDVVRLKEYDGHVYDCFGLDREMPDGSTKRRFVGREVEVIYLHTDGIHASIRTSEGCVTWPISALEVL